MKFSKEAIDLSNISTEEKVRLSIQVSNKLKQTIIDKAKALNINPSLFIRSVLVKELNSGFNQ